MKPAADDQAVDLAFKEHPADGSSQRVVTAFSRRFAMGVVYGAGTASGSLLITAVIWWINRR